MDWRGVATGLKAVGRARLLVLVAIAGAVSGCAGGNQGGPMAAMASATPPGAQTVAFESIDGPPPQVFDRFVRVLDNEAQTRNVAIVSRDGSAGYHAYGTAGYDPGGDRDRLRGGRIFDICAADPSKIETRMILLSELG